jgi:hypothetical protein
MNGSPNARSRLGLGLTAIWVPAVLTVVGRVLWFRDLPPRVASHWKGFALPDQTSSSSHTFITVLAVTVVAAVVASVAVALRHRVPAAANTAILLGPLIAAPVAAAWAISGWATVAAGSAAAATLGARILLIVPALALGLVPIALLRRNPASATLHAPTRPLDLSPGQRAAWSTVLGGRMFVVLAVVIAAAAVVVGIFAEPWTAVPLGLAAVMTAALGRIQVTVDSRGLRLRSELFGIPFKHIAVEDIATARSDDIDPTRWGGWGYRMAPGRSALVLRSGPGLVVERRDGGRFAVTLEDPETPARLLTTLVQAGRTPR